MKNLKRNFVVVIALLISAYGFSQTTLERVDEFEPAGVTTVTEGIAGTWNWVSQNGTNNFELTVYDRSGVLCGQHCSVFYNGANVDCSDGIMSITLQKISTNLFEGTIKSGFSNTLGRIKLKYDPLSEKVLFFLTKKPSGINYLPKEIVLVR